MAKVTKGVIVAAGWGTRFLPASKAIPKVLFPIIDKPIIQYVAEEFVASGITDITFVLAPHFEAVKRHFEPFEALNQVLAKAGKEDQIDKLRKIEKMADFHYVYQRQDLPVGTGTAVLAAKETVGNDPFLLSWSDELCLSDPPRAKQSIDAFAKVGGMMIGCIRTTDPKDGAKYGFVVGDEVDRKIIRVREMVEKPGEGKAPSELTSKSGHVLVPEIFDYLERGLKEIQPGKELYVNIHGMAQMLADGYPVYAVEFENCQYYDTGEKLGYLKALVDIGLENPEFGEKFKDYLKKLKI